MRMKKLFLMLFAMIATVAAYAENYNVTVETQKQVKYVLTEDYNTVVWTCTEKGQTLTFAVVADTPREAEDKAINQCGTTCETDVWRTVASAIKFNGKICDKLQMVKPWKATAVISNLPKRLE